MWSGDVIIDDADGTKGRNVDDKGMHGLHEGGPGTAGCREVGEGGGRTKKDASVKGGAYVVRLIFQADSLIRSISPWPGGFRFQ